MKKTILILILFISILYSNTSKLDTKLSIYIDKNNDTYENIIKKDFINLYEEHVNLGFAKKNVVWIKLNIKNNSNDKIDKILEINNPLLEKIFLYSNNKIYKSGMLYIDDSRKFINPSFKISIDKRSNKTHYLKILNSTTALQFSINLLDKESEFKKDRQNQFLIILFAGAIIAFLIYAIALYFFTKDRSYFLYAFYILALLFQQLTYVGFLPLYMPREFTYIDNLIVVPKVGIIIISAIIFARSFLKTKFYPKIDKVYKILIFIVFLQILFLSTPYFYYPEITVLTGLFFIIFNFYAAIYVYKKGNKQARFFILGWGFVLFGFFLSIIDALGLYSIMYNMTSLVLLCTTFEAFFLLLAFVDKLNILQKEKNDIDKKLLDELQKRNVIVEQEVKSRTKMLNNLYRELHHRVKNNLQIMLSIIRLQGDKFNNNILKEQFQKLENRIKSIAKTHEILYLNDDIEKIDMYEYIYSLSEDVNISFDNNSINTIIRTEVKMPLREAVYIGIIINELLTNSIKYASSCDKITINLYKKEEYLYLDIIDNGSGYDKKNISKKSLGLILVNNLVVDQLSGKIEENIINKCEYNIRFKI